MDRESPTMNFGNIEFEYSIVPTKRKTVGVVVEPDGRVIVKAPTDLIVKKFMKLSIIKENG